MVNRGEVWLTDLNPVRGSEQAGTRPMMIVQVDDISARLPTMLVVPFTTNLRWERVPFCARIGAGEGGLASDSVALCHQTRVIDHSRLIRRLGCLSSEALSLVEDALLSAIGM